MKINTEIFKNSKPVLLLKGYDLGSADIGEFVTQSFTTEVDRGQLKTLDFTVTSLNRAFANNDQGNFTLSVGGQNVLENIGITNYGIPNTNAFRFMQVKTLAQENQTLGVIYDARLSIQAIRYFQLLARYTTQAHELFLKSWSTEYLPGYKRKGYQITRPVGNTQTLSIKPILPKNKGNIIGIGISNALGSLIEDLLNTLITVKANGITIIEKVQAINFNILSGKDYFLNKIFLSPGTELELIIEPVLLPGQAVITPAIATCTHDFTIFFQS